MTIIINEDLCKGCGYCIEICPVNYLRDSKKINKKGYKLPETNESNSCTLCKRCELLCPEMAIDVVKEEA